MAYKKAAGTDYIPENYQKEKVSKKKKVKASPKPGWILRVSPGMGIIALIFIIGMSLVVQNVWINYLGFQITGLKSEITELETNNQKLELKIANIVSLDKIEEVAVNQLGMIYPGNESVHYIFTSNAPKENTNTTSVQLASLRMSSEIPQGQNFNREDNYPRQALLGTVQDFFYWLMRDSKY